MGKLAINEIFYSLQGESTAVGRPTVFVRLMGCPLRCSWCDTEYAFYEGKQKTFDEIIFEIEKHSTKLVELTGGEPLAQPQSIPFMQKLCDLGYEVMLETSGAFSVKDVPSSVKIIMDIKCPGSLEDKRNYWDNLAFLKPGKDEIKFVISSEQDFIFLKDIVSSRKLSDRFTILVSPVFGKIENSQLAKWVLDSALPLRMQIQMHKYIWGPEVRGV